MIYVPSLSTALKRGSSVGSAPPSFGAGLGGGLEMGGGRLWCVGFGPPVGGGDITPEWVL